MIHRIIVLFVGLSICVIVQAQQTDSVEQGFSWNAYIESYYTAVWPNPINNRIAPDFLFNHNRTADVNLNIAMLQSAYTDKRIRANVGLMTGTYALYNLAHEPSVFKHIYEANAGVKLSAKHGLWLDAGIFESYIGHESAIGDMQPTLSRSLAAENSPYYVSGARLNYKHASEKWNLAIYYLNGWQQVFNHPQSFRPHLGFQFQYKPYESLLINYSNFIGTDAPPDEMVLRLFHDWYIIWKPTYRWELRALFDLGTDQYQLSNAAVNWYAANVVARYKFASRWHVAARLEQFSEPYLYTLFGNPGENKNELINAASAGIDFEVAKQALIRTESRWIQGENPIFLLRDGAYSRSLLMQYVALCIRF